MEGRYSTRSPAVKRLMREAQELCEPTDQYFAQPLEDNLFEWHFTIRGPLDSDFQGGVYHGRIILPVDYPMKPPSIIWLTPNGRFETNKKICLSISGHHPESWQPSWSIRTALLAIIGFMPTHPSGAIGSLDYKPEERKTLAKKSRDWKCPVCGDVSEILLEPNPESSQTSQEARELATQISFQGEKPKSPDTKIVSEATVNSSTSPSEVVSSAEGASNNASTHVPSSAPANEPLSATASAQNPGHFFSTWPCPPVAPSNSAIPPPFLYYPWAPHVPSYGEQVGCVAAQIPRFPYPPSYYASRGGNTNFYPSGYVFPHGVGMFPCPLPPLPQTTAECNPQKPGSNVPISTDIGSCLSLNKGLSHSLNTSVIPEPSSTASKLPSPQNSPLKSDYIQRTQAELHDSEVAKEETHIDNADASTLSTFEKSSEGIRENVQIGSEHVSSTISETSVSQDRNDENTGDFLALMRDVGGDQNYSTDFQPNPTQVMNLETISQVLSRAFDPVQVNTEGPESGASRVVEIPQESDDASAIGDHCHIERSIDNSENTDTDISISLMKKESMNESTGLEISHSELLADAEEDDDSRILAVDMSDTEQRSNFERSTSCSMPELKMNMKQGTSKGLRQRQSATARVPTDSTDGEQNSSEATSGGVRQRIEAVSGDSVNQLRFPHTGGVPVANDVRHNAHHRGNAHSAYDISFLVMVGLCAATIFIIFNRLFYRVDFSDLFY